MRHLLWWQKASLKSYIRFVSSYLLVRGPPLCDPIYIEYPLAPSPTNVKIVS